MLSLISIHQTIRPGQERMESARPPAGCYSRKQSMAEANEVGIPIELRLDDVATIESGASELASEFRSGGFQYVCQLSKLEQLLELRPRAGHE